MEVSQTGILPVGRGFGYPFRFESGGVAPNMPAKPTQLELVTGLVANARFVLTWSTGSAFMVRGGGTSAGSLLFSTATSATADMLSKEVVDVLSTEMPYANVSNVRASLSEDAIGIEMSIRPSPSTQAMNVSFSSPLRGSGA